MNTVKCPYCGYERDFLLKKERVKTRCERCKKKFRIVRTIPLAEGKAEFKVYKTHNIEAHVRGNR